MFAPAFGPVFNQFRQQQQLAPIPFQPMPFEGGMGQPYKGGMPGFGQPPAQPSVLGSMSQPGWGFPQPQQPMPGPSPFSPMLQQMFSGPGGGQWLQGLFQNGMPGMVSGGQGSRGPMPSPFAGLGKFQGPFGNGGGPLMPSQPGRFGWGGGNQWRQF